MNDDDIAAEQRRAEAAQWFARLKTLPVSHGTLNEFFAWRRHRGNAEAFEEAERFWSEAEKVGDRPAILRAVQAATGRRRSRVRFAIAAHPVAAAGIAMVLALAVFGGLISFLRDEQGFRTATGEQRIVTLDDGSRLNLNTETAVTVRYTAAARHVILIGGEALFSVAKDQARPFTVSANGVTVTATGTRFDVALKSNRTLVTLIEGRISVGAPDGATTWLEPGEQWRWPPEGLRVHMVKTENITAWTQGRIVLDNTALADAVAEVNRYGGNEVILDAPHLGTKRLSGSFQVGDSESFAAAVTAFLPLRRRLDSLGRIHLVAADRKKGPDR